MKRQFALIIAPASLMEVLDKCVAEAGPFASEEELLCACCMAMSEFARLAHEIEMEATNGRGRLPDLSRSSRVPSLENFNRGYRGALH